jgi:hypothetical protein
MLEVQKEALANRVRQRLVALLKAAEQGDLTTLERLVDQGVDVDAMDGVRPNLVPQRHLRLCSVPPCPPSPVLRLHHHQRNYVA